MFVFKPVLTTRDNLKQKNPMLV